MTFLNNQIFIHLIFTCIQVIISNISISNSLLITRFMITSLLMITCIHLMNWIFDFYRFHISRFVFITWFIPLIFPCIQVRIQEYEKIMIMLGWLWNLIIIRLPVSRSVSRSSICSLLIVLLLLLRLLLIPILILIICW